ncbi:MAG: nucleoside deaminase [Clostridia bacterium]|nr:nucleoside deaminase [Clostridia bacterium]
MIEKYMRLALKQAQKAEKLDEVPIGAIIVLNGKVIAKGHNLTEKTQIATRHAEIIAIEKACKKLKSWRLDGAELFVTIEPCPMCAGAIANARIKKVYFGAYEPKSGSAESKFNVLSDSGLNHKVEFQGGILEKECREIIKNYFKLKRR